MTLATVLVSHPVPCRTERPDLGTRESPRTEERVIPIEPLAAP
jgi:hypothetical protein